MVYGSDPRIKEDIDEDAAYQAAVNNFQWILGNQAMKAKIFSTGFRPPPTLPPNPTP